MTAPSSTPSSSPSSPARPNRAERRAVARGRGPAGQAAVPVPRVTGQVQTRPRGGAAGAPRRTG